MARYENDPQPPVEPEAAGIPDHAVDTSTSFDEADRPRFDDSPPALPADEPQAVDEPGVTGAAAAQGESLDDRLAREEPDTSPEQPAAPAPPVGRLSGTAEQLTPGGEAPDVVAADRGEAGGGLAAEEAAVREVTPEQATGAVPEDPAEHEPGGYDVAGEEL